MDGDVRGWERRASGGGGKSRLVGGLLPFCFCLKKDSHEELWRRRVVAGGAGLSEPIAGQFLALELVGVSFSGQPGDLLLELFHLLDELGLLVLQVMFLLDPLVPARLGITSVLQGPPLLLEADHLVLGEAPQVPVELSHGHGDQLVIREPVLHAAGRRGGGGRGVRLVRVL